MIKKLFTALLLLACLSCSLYAEQSYSITETQLTKMENLTRQQSELIQTQQKQIENLNKQIKSYQTSLRKLESRNAVKTSLITVLLGVSAGVIAYNAFN